MEPGRRGLKFDEVRRYLRQEMQASYEFLCQPNAKILWTHCSPELARVIREVRETPGQTGSNTVDSCRNAFFKHVEEAIPEAQDTVAANLAWHIIVESALLNDQLIRDMKSLVAKNANLPLADGVAFYGPKPDPVACHLFNNYVQCRWPIHVFALDPIAQDQNIGEAFSRRRELQLALALAASQRFVSFQNLTRFTRRLEQDLETIGLNRTAVAFSHGDDTFGWRFYPRVQTPPIPSNLEATTRDFLIGSQTKDQDIRTRRLEPGIRECTALVVLPSFVPNITVDTRTNWFRLANHRLALQWAGQCTMDVCDAVDLSRDITELRELSSQCRQDAHLFRDGEMWRLFTAVDQLERQLPTQTSIVPMPYENTLGGFEIFNSGITDLGPQLLGWYGAPGIQTGQSPQNFEQLANAVAATNGNLAQATSQLSAINLQIVAASSLPAGEPRDTKLKELEGSKKATQTLIDTLAPLAKSANDAYSAARNAAGSSTSLYLIGSNFSILNSKVIAGGQALSNVRLISRELLQVEIPTAVNTVQVGGKPHVDIHVATPYGPTSHLHVPIVTSHANLTQAPDVGRAVEVVKAEILDASKRQVDDALKGLTAFELGQLPAVEWTSDTITGKLNTEDKSVSIKVSPVQLKISPVDQPFSVEPAALACFINFKTKNGTSFQKLTDPGSPSKRFVLGPFEIQNNQSINQETLANSRLLAALVAQQGVEIVELEIQGFVQLKVKDGMPDTVPVLKVKKPLIVKLSSATN